MTDQPGAGYNCVTIKESNRLKRLRSRAAQLIAQRIMRCFYSSLRLPGNSWLTRTTISAKTRGSEKFGQINDRKSNRVSVERGHLCLVQAEASGRIAWLNFARNLPAPLAES